MLAAGKKAGCLGLPVVFDPVGVGATGLRTEMAQKIVREIRLAVIRGNMSEIKFLAGMNVAIKGVDAMTDAKGAESAAQTLAKELSCVVAVTGKRDIVTDGTRTFYIDNGHEMLSRVTGTGCMATSLIGAYCGAAAARDYLTAAVAGLVSMGLAGELAHKSLAKDEGIGAFKVRLFDWIYNLTPEMIAAQGRVSASK